MTSLNQILGLTERQIRYKYNMFKNKLLHKNHRNKQEAKAKLTELKITASNAPRGKKRSTLAQLKNEWDDVLNPVEYYPAPYDEWKETKLKKLNRRVKHLTRKIKAMTKGKDKFPFKWSRIERRTADSGAKYTYKFYQWGISIFDEVEDFDRLENFIRPRLPKMKHDHVRYSITLQSDKGKRIYTSYMKDPEDALEDIMIQIGHIMAQYQNAFELDKIIIGIVNEKDLIHIGQAGLSYDRATKKWLILSNRTTRNCAYVSIQTGINYINGKYDCDVLEQSRKMKSRINPQNKDSVSENDLQNIANHLKRTIKLYNNKFELISVYNPEKKIHKRLGVREAVDIQISGGHYIALIRWEHVPKDMKVKAMENIHDSTSTDVPAVDELKMIKKHPRSVSFDDRICGWDIETYPVFRITSSGEVVKEFQCYAVGFFDGKDYVDFWGKDCLIRFLQYLDDRQYDNITCYAHNSGKFDLLELMNKAILSSDIFKLICEDNEKKKAYKPLEQESRWLSISIESVNTHNLITFRDSMSYLQGSLEKLGKEYKVKHQKLVEVVSHKDINQWTWKKYYNDIKEYLYHDVMCVYEVVMQFAKDLWKITYSKHISCENRTRNILEHIFKKEFKKVRPSWLKNDQVKRALEYDGYCEELNLAFEYRGSYHYAPNHQNRMGKELEAIQKRDKVKEQISVEKGVTLIVIPNIKWKNILTCVRQQLIAEGVVVDLKLKNEDIIDTHFEERGINVTQCYTGASIAKKLFYMRYYNHSKYPIWKLTKDMDRFIRKSYYGGRVEDFIKTGVEVKGKLYYYDFTSLFPDQASKNDIPYGEPKMVDGKDIKIHPSNQLYTINSEGNKERFFGFIKCRVREIEGNKSKPIHCIMYDPKDRTLTDYQRSISGKLLFPKFENWTELTIFSEEIRLGLRNKKYEYEFIEGMSFKAEKILKHFNNDLFKLKAEAKEAGNDSLALTYKIILNSGYGFWALRTERRNCVMLYNRGDSPVKMYMEQNNFINEADIGNYSLMRVIKDLPVEDNNVAIASAITSYSRMRLWSLIDDIESRGYKVFMCDTDSCITNCKISDHEDLYEKYVQDESGEFGDGAQLGGLKNEVFDEFRKKLKKGQISQEKYDYIIDTYGEDLFFDHLLFGGLKYYGGKNDELGVDVVKCKSFNQGVTKLTYDKLANSFIDINKQKREQTGDVEKYKPQMVRGVEQTVEQFVCGREGYLSEESPFTIKIKEVFKQLPFGYNKARTVENSDWLVPLVI